MVDATPTSTNIDSTIDLGYNFFESKFYNVNPNTQLQPQTSALIVANPSSGIMDHTINQIDFDKENQMIDDRARF